MLQRRDQARGCGPVIPCPTNDLSQLIHRGILVRLTHQLRRDIELVNDPLPVAGRDSALSGPVWSNMGAKRSVDTQDPNSMNTAAGKKTRRMQQTLQRGAGIVG